MRTIFCNLLITLLNLNIYLFLHSFTRRSSRASLYY